MLGGLKEDLMCIRTQGPHKRLSQTCLWVLSAPMEEQVSRGLPQGQGLWLQHTWEAWHVSPSTEPLSRQPTNWRTIIPKKFLYCCKSSRACNRLPNPGIPQRDWEPPGIWLWRPAEFDYRTSTGLGKQTLGGHNKTFCTPGLRWKEQWPHKRLSQTCPWVSGSLWQRRELTMASSRVRGTEHNSPGSCSMLTVLLKEVAITAIIPTIVWPQAKL